jgi:D-aspartate ligase
MYDSRDATYKLLEVNARVWGWHTLAVHAGVNLPYLLYQQIIGENPAPVDGFAVGAKWMRPITDTPTALGEVFKGRLSLGSYLASVRGPKQLAPGLSWDDPAPFFVEFLIAPYLWAKRGF